MKHRIPIFTEKRTGVFLSLRYTRRLARWGIIIAVLLGFIVTGQYLEPQQLQASDVYQIDENPVGEGLYVKVQRWKYFHRYERGRNSETGMEEMLDILDSVLVYELIPIQDTIPGIEQCDSITTKTFLRIDSTYEGSETDPVTLETVDKYKKDSVFQYEFIVDCYKLDTTCRMDTSVHRYSGSVTDTATVYDTFMLGTPERPTDTTMQFCPHQENPYYPYAALFNRLKDSIAKLEAELEIMERNWTGLPVDTSKDTLAERLTERIIGKTRRESMSYGVASTNDSARFLSTYKHLRDSLYKILPNTPAHLRAKIEAFKKLLAKTDSGAIAYQEYHIDSIDVIASLYTGGNAVQDTFRIRTIPLFYTRHPDTTLQHGKSIYLWSGSPYLPVAPTDTILGYGEAPPQEVTPPGSKPQTYVEITYGRAIRGNDLTFINRTGFTFDPTTLIYVTDRVFDDPNHLQSYVGELIRSKALPLKVYSSTAQAFNEAGTPSRSTVNGKPRGYQDTLPPYPVRGPYYTADTLDGDSVFFPIMVKATQQNTDRFLHHPADMCEYYDTIKIRVVKGYKVSGYVSYAGLWFPSQVGDTKSPDVPTYDKDLLPSQLQHLPANNVKVFLKRLSDGFTFDSATSGPDGYFTFPDYFDPDTYLISARSWKKESVYGDVGLSGTDAAWVQNYVANKFVEADKPENSNPVYSMWWYGANVDLTDKTFINWGLDGVDASSIQNKIANKLPYNNHFTDINTLQPIDDWAYSEDTLILDRDTMHHVRGIMRGDADRSYYDIDADHIELMFKGNKRKGDMDRAGTIPVEVERTQIDFPIISLDSGYMKGFEIFLYYNTKKVEPLGVQLPVRMDPAVTNLVYNVQNDLIMTTWVGRQNHYEYVHVGDTVLILTLNLLGKPGKNFSKNFQYDKINYVVTDTMPRSVRWKVAMPALEFYEPEYLSDSGYYGRNPWDPYVEEGDTIYELPESETALISLGNPTDEPSHIISVIPNPIVTWGDVTYYVSQSSLVNLRLYSLMGQPVLTFVEAERQLGLYRLSMNMQTLPSGVYILRLETTRAGRTEFDVAKIVIKR